MLPFLLGKSYTKVDLMDRELDGVWGVRDSDPYSSPPPFVVSGYLSGPSVPSSAADDPLGQSSALPACLLASRSNCSGKTLSARMSVWAMGSVQCLPAQGGLTADTAENEEKALAQARLRSNY